MIDPQRYGPWALIVGGSEGIGEALARRIGGVGINLLLVARKPEALEQTAARVRADSGVEVRTVSVDIAAPDGFARIEHAAEGLEIGLLVHNVGGGGGRGPFLERPVEDALASIRSNPEMQVRLARRFAPAMAERGAGGILFVGSMAGNAGGAGFAVYSAAKAFTQIFAEALWAELEPQGVDVLALLVGSADTPARRRSMMRDSADVSVASSDEVAEQCLAQLRDGPVQPLARNAGFFRTLATPDRREAAVMLRGLLGGMAPK